MLAGLLNTYEKEQILHRAFLTGRGKSRPNGGVSCHVITNSRTVLAFKV